MLFLFIGNTNGERKSTKIKGVYAQKRGAPFLKNRGADNISKKVFVAIHPRRKRRGILDKQIKKEIHHQG